MSILLELDRLIKEAKTFGSAACLEGRHNWTSEGGRSCPKEIDFHMLEECSQPVYRCADCGTYDFGEKGGPAWTECFQNCLRKKDL